MICERCNTENLDGSQYCDECGASLAARTRKGETGPTAGDPPPENRAVSATGARSGEHALRRSDPRPTRRADDPFAGVPDASERAEGNHSPQKSPFGSDGDGQEVRTAASAPASAVASATAHAKLVIHRGRSVGKEFPMSEDETHIGRWDADGGIFPDVDLDADDPEAKVSRRHARITRRGEQYFVEDLGSTNGTFINRGRRLLPGDRHPLRDGDEVIVGKTFLRFHVIK